MATGSDSDLAALREQLDQLDGELIDVVARRAEVVAAIGRCKRDAGQGTRDFARERLVLEQAGRRAAQRGLAPGLAEQLLLVLIRHSLASQEQARVVAQGEGSGRTALVIGGCGKMGRWFARFLAAQGFTVRTADPAGPTDGLPWCADWQQGDVDDALVVVATPLRETSQVLADLAQRHPAGLVFDVASLKTPVRPGLDALVAAGVRVTSVHPMFGPDTALLSGRHVLFVDLGVPGATAEARALFAPTMADQVELTLDEHDRVIAWVLGLSHAVNLAFSSALADDGVDVPRLARVSSTTFEAQLDVARRVASENPHLYFDIQHANAHGDEALAALERAVHRLRESVGQGDEATFVQRMIAGRHAVARRTGAEDGSHVA